MHAFPRGGAAALRRFVKLRDDLPELPAGHRGAWMCGRETTFSRACRSNATPRAPTPTASVCEALKEAGRPPEWVVYPRQAHGWREVATRVDFATRMERFLKQRLDPDTPR
jgi:acetyl esterase/lipase